MYLRLIYWHWSSHVISLSTHEVNLRDVGELIISIKNEIITTKTKQTKANPYVKLMGYDVAMSSAIQVT